MSIIYTKMIEVYFKMDSVYFRDLSFSIISL